MESHGTYLLTNPLGFGRAFCTKRASGNLLRIHGYVNICLSYKKPTDALCGIGRQLSLVQREDEFDPANAVPVRVVADRRSAVLRNAVPASEVVATFEVGNDTPLLIERNREAALVDKGCKAFVKEVETTAVGNRNAIDNQSMVEADVNDRQRVVVEPLAFKAEVWFESMAFIEFKRSRHLAVQGKDIVLASRHEPLRRGNVEYEVVVRATPADDHIQLCAGVVPEIRVERVDLVRPPKASVETAVVEIEDRSLMDWLVTEQDVRIHEKVA